MKKVIIAALLIIACTPRTKEAQPSLQQVTDIQSFAATPNQIDKVPFTIQGRTYIIPVVTTVNGTKVITLDLSEMLLPVSTKQQAALNLKADAAALKLKADASALATKADLAAVKLKADITYVNSVAGRITALETKIRQTPVPLQKNYDSIIAGLNKQIEVLKSDNHTIQNRQIVLDTTLQNLPTIYTTGTYGITEDNPLKP